MMVFGRDIDGKRVINFVAELFMRGRSHRLTMSFIGSKKNLHEAGYPVDRFFFVWYKEIYIDFAQ